MKLKIIIRVLIVLFISSCVQRTLNKKSLSKNAATSQVKFSSGLTINNGINRGINYTDPHGTDYSIRNIPIKITNDSIIPIQIHLSFSSEYNHPNLAGGEKFKLIPLPREWGLDHTDITESMIDEIPKLIAKPVLNSIIEPGKDLILSIGSIYPRPAKTTGVLPRTLFAQNDSTVFNNCEWLMEDKTASSQQIPLMLKTTFGEQCMVIPCGHISYPEQ